jgi:hypothetical protein
MDRDLAKAQRRAFLDAASLENRQRSALWAARANGLPHDPEELVKQFVHHDIYRRESAAKLLIQIGPYATPAITKALKHDNYLSRAWAAFVVRKAGLYSPEIISLLRELLRDDMASDEAAKALKTFES